MALSISSYVYPNPSWIIWSSGRILIYLHDFCLKLIHGVKLYRIRFCICDLAKKTFYFAWRQTCILFQMDRRRSSVAIQRNICTGQQLLKVPVYGSIDPNNRRLFLHTVQRIYRLAKLQNQNKKEHMSTQDITILNILFLDILSSPYRFLSAY